MKAINKTIVSKNLPKQTNVDWVKPTETGWDKYHFINGKWVPISSSSNGNNNNNNNWGDKNSCVIDDLSLIRAIEGKYFNWDKMKSLLEKKGVPLDEWLYVAVGMYTSYRVDDRYKIHPSAAFNLDKDSGFYVGAMVFDLKIADLELQDEYDGETPVEMNIGLLVVADEVSPIENTPFPSYYMYKQKLYGDFIKLDIVTMMPARTGGGTGAYPSYDISIPFETGSESVSFGYYGTMTVQEYLDCFDSSPQPSN